MDVENNPPAFPTTKPLDGWGDPNQGMTLRDWFAGQAMIALGSYPNYVDQRARDAYGFADAMIAERGEQK